MRLAVLFLSVLFLAPAAGAQAPDLVLTRGRIVTPPELARDVPPSALAIRDGIILAVGSDTDITALQGPATVAIDLQGAAVLPGLVDSHAHLYGLGKSLAQIDLVGTGSAAEVVDIVREAASAFPGGRLDRRPRLGPERLDRSGVPPPPPARRHRPDRPV